MAIKISEILTLKIQFKKKTAALVYVFLNLL